MRSCGICSHPGHNRKTCKAGLGQNLSRRDYDALRYRRAVQEGKCPQCSRDARENRTLCSACTTKKYKCHKRKTVTGKCSQCYIRDPMPGFKSCAPCRNTHRRNSHRLKEETIQAYGGACACCNEWRLPFLTLDHIDGSGARHRKEFKGGKGAGGHMYRWTRKNGYPDGFQVLCWNCNSGRHVNGGNCPHKEIDPALLLAAEGVV